MSGRWTSIKVPFNRPYMVGTELGYITQAVQNRHLSGDGPFSRRCERWLEQETECHRALMTQSCTAALELAALLLRLEPGDEVIMPSFTFVSTANAFVLRGAVPVFVDIRPDTLNIDETSVERAVTWRTRAVVAVHYAGVPCEMNRLEEIAARHQLAIIEDAAHALGSRYNGRAAGSFGSLAALSFHETKNVISGEGGAILINDRSFVERAEILREKGTNRAQFFRGQIDKYTWIDVGSSLLPSDLTCAFLWGQLERATDINRDRMATWQRYHEALEPLEAKGRLRRPIVPSDCTHNAHMYYILLPDLNVRTRVIESLARCGVGTVFHYVPLHSSPAGIRLARTPGPMPRTDAASTRLLRLPLWVGMQPDDVDWVTRNLEQILA